MDDFIDTGDAAVRMPPGPRMPALAQTALSMGAPIWFLEQCQRRFGSCFTVRMVRPLGTTVHVAEPEAVKAVFTGDPATFRAGEGAAIFEPLLGQHSLVVLDGPRHLRKRRLMLPPFHGPRLQRFEQLIRDLTTEELDRWALGTPFALKPRMQSIALEVMLRAVFGIEDAARLRDLRPRLQHLVRTVMGPGAMLVALAGRFGAGTSWTPWGRFRRAVDAVDELIFDEIGRRRDDPSLAKRDDILSMLLQSRDEDGDALTDAELRDELITLLLAGHESSATAAAWGFELLLRNSMVLGRVREELAAGDTTYIDAVVREVLRLRPVVPFVTRHVSKPVSLNGYRLPQGVTVSLSPFLLHRRADLYPNPHEFRPERFLQDPPDSYSWIPFGGGIRRCLGASFAMMELRVILSTILSDAELALANPEPEAMELRTVLFVPKRGVPVILRDRRRGPRIPPDPGPPSPDKRSPAAA